MTKIFVSTYPFAMVDKTPLELLDRHGFQYQLNPHKRKLTIDEIIDLAKDCDGLIAGTEKLDKLLDKNRSLKIISRVGIGLDSVPLKRCRSLGIKVAYTPDAVTMAVVELTIGLMISITRKVSLVDRNIRQGLWDRPYGKRLEESTIGIIGFGRVGSRVAEYLSVFRPQQVLVNDIKDKSLAIKKLATEKGITIAPSSKEEIYRKSDIVTLHVPLTPRTKNLINADSLSNFRKDAYIINTSRGGIVNEEDLFLCLKEKAIEGAVLDVFENEPYSGKLNELDNIILTSHIGSCSFDCRAKMEIQATENAVNFFLGRDSFGEVPAEEYEYQGV